MLRLAVLAALVGVCLSIPVAEKSKVLDVEKDLELQALAAMQKNDAPGKFKDFLPLINQAVVYTGAVLPSLKAKKEHKKINELTQGALMQTYVSAAGQNITSEIEAMLPSADDMLTAMVAIGNVMGGSSGYNPIQMMTNLVGKEDMVKVIDDLMKFPLHFPEPTENEIVAAEQMVLSIGLGFGSQETAMDRFLDSLAKDKKDMIANLQKNVIDKLMNAMMTPDGKPTPGLVEEIKRQMREMENRKGNTDMMPDELKEIVRDAIEQASHTSAKSLEQQTLVDVTAAKSPEQFKDFLPLVNQVVVYASAVLPSVKAKKQNKHNADLTQSLLVQTYDEATGGNKTAPALSDLEVYLPTADDMLSAMVAIGNLVGGSSGYNPVQMLTNVVGKGDMVKIIDEIMKFPLRFPDPTEDEMVAAEQVVLSVGLGFGNQETAVNQFLKSLSSEKKDMIDSLEKNVIMKMVDSMVSPDGKPTPALVEEVKREMREMEHRKGNTDMMPEEIKQVLKEQQA